MFGTVTLALVSFALCLGASARADEAEDKAVALVEKRGGTVTRDEKRLGKPVVAVDLRGTTVADAGLKELAPFTNLSSLNFLGTDVTDAGLKELAPLKSLRSLDLHRTNATEEGVKALRAALPKCKIER